MVKKIAMPRRVSVQRLTLASSSWNPPKLEIDKSYVWRVDEVNSTGTTKGDVWAFTAKKPEQHVVQEPADDDEPPPPPLFENHRVARLFSSPRGQVVVLEDPAKKGQDEGTYVEVGEKLYKGTLVYMHPRGVVTQEDNGTRYFHKVDEIIKDGRRLTPEEEPEVYHELEKLENQGGELVRAAEPDSG